MKKRIMTAGMLAMILAMGMTACANADTKEKSTTKKEQVSESDEKKEQKKSDNEAYVMNEKQKKSTRRSKNIQCRRTAENSGRTGKEKKNLRSIH